VAETLIQQGNLSQAEYEYRRGLQIGTDEQGNSLPIVGLAWTGLAFLELERNHLDQADFLVDKGQVAIGGIGALNFLESYLVEARLSYARADRIGCVEKLHAARATAARFIASMIDDLVVVMTAVRFHIGFGDLDSSRVLLSECESLYNKIVSDQSEIGRYWHFQLYLSFQITLAHLALAEHKSEDVQERLAPLLDEAISFGYIYRAIEMYCLMALAAKSTGKMDEAIAWIEKGLQYAEPEGIVRLFLDFGAPMTGLLYDVAARGVNAQAIGRLLAGSVPLEKPDLYKPGTEQILEPLSKREVEVLQLIAEGQTNSDIARILVIAPNTVKKHINNIFRKLCVASRTQAVAQARMLGLLK
jgi:LuxR family maltose regulon positive regulatory protein